MDAMVSMLLVLALAFVTQTVPKPETHETAAADSVEITVPAPEPCEPDSVECRE